MSLLFNTTIEVLQHAITMENSTRKVDHRSTFMIMHKIELIRYILNKTDGLKSIRTYIAKSLSNYTRLIHINNNYIFDFHNGYIHTTNIVTKVDTNTISFYQIEHIRSSTIKYISSVTIKKNTEEITLSKTEIKSAIIFQLHFVPHLSINLN